MLVHLSPLPYWELISYDLYGAEFHVFDGKNAISTAYLLIPGLYKELVEYCFPYGWVLEKFCFYYELLYDILHEINKSKLAIHCGFVVVMLFFGLL